jgi:hypothetical protein
MKDYLGSESVGFCYCLLTSELPSAIQLFVCLASQTGIESICFILVVLLIITETVLIVCRHNVLFDYLDWSVHF